MMPSTKGRQLSPSSLCLFWMVSFFLSNSLFAANHFSFFNPPSPAAGLYQVNTTHTYTVAAMSGPATDLSYNNFVTVGLYNTINPPLKTSDTGVTIVGNGVTFTGSAPLSFTSGLLTFTMTYEAGSDSEQVYIQDSGGTPVTVGNTYPGVFGATTGGAALTIQGFPTDYFLEDANLDATAASYPVSTDLLVPQTDTTTLDNLDSQGSDQGVTIPLAGGVTGTTGIDTAAASYAITNVSGGYAAGGRIVLANLYFKKIVNTSSTPVSIEVILDYDGTLADYNNPRTNIDTVYVFSAADVSFPNFHSFNPSGSPFSSGSFTSAPFKPFITGGQIIVRVWGGNPANRLLVRYETFTGASTDLSSVNIPYSTKNVSPVKAVITPSTVLSSNPVALTYTITNQYSSPVTQILYQIPPNSIGGTDWNITSITNPVPGHAGSSVAITSNPVGTSAPGTITVNFTAGAPMTVNEAITLTMNGTASSESANWPISMFSVSSNAGPAPIDSSQANVRTLGVPTAPSGFTAAVTNFINSGGGSVSLAWTQPPANENPTGYILSGGPNGPVTLPFSTVSYVDSPVVNKTNYTYTIKTINLVAQSPPVTASPNPIAAYVNPASATGLTALTGGTTIQLNWTAPVAPAGSYPVTGYQIWRDTSPGMGTAVTIAEVGLVTTYKDSTVSGGTSYYYALSSMDNLYSSGPPLGPHHSALSGTATGFPLGNPPSGLGVVLTTGPNTLNLSWSAPANVLNTPLSNFNIFRSVDGGAFSLLTSVGGSTLTYPDTAVTTGHNYQYFVKALDSLAVVSNASATVAGQVGPSAPATPVAVASSSGITLTWTPNGAGENVTNYVVVRSPGSALLTGGPASFLDSTTALGTDYSYYVMAVNSTGVTGPASTTITSARLPAAPTGFTVSPNVVAPTTFNISWTAIPEANLTGYQLIRGTTSSFPPAGSVTVSLGLVTSYSDPGLSSGSVYYYFLRGVNIGGDGANATASHEVPPNAPSPLTATSLASSVSLKWSSPVSEGATSYTVWAEDQGPPVGNFLSLGSQSATILNYFGALAGHNYQFYVTATNPGGTGLASVTVTSARLPAALPSLTVAPDPATPTTLDINWTASSEANLTGYKLIRGTTNALPPAAPVTVSLGLVTSYVDPGLSAGTTYFYFLEGVNIGGTGAPITAGRQIAPNPPTGLTAFPFSSSVSLSWSPSAAAVSYTIWSKDLPGGSFTSLGTQAATFLNNLTALAGHSYQYFVTATDIGTAGPPLAPGGTSLDSVTITSGRVPGPPAGLSITGINTNNDISTAWTDVTGTVPNATSVDLLVNSSPTTTGAAVINIAPATTTTHIDLGENPDTTYSYWLRVNNPYGTGDVTATPVSQLTYPGAPTILSANLLPDNVTTQLTWSTTTSTTAVSYKIYRALGSNGFIPVTTVSAIGLSFPASIQLSVLNGQAYSFKISAVNPTGEGPASLPVSLFTGPSAPQSVTAVSGLSATVPQVGVSWALNNVSEGVTTYLVQRASSPGGPFATVGTLASPTAFYLDSGLSDVTPYYYLLVAESNGVLSQVLTANAVSVTAYEMPNTPNSPLAASGNGVVNLSWTAAAPTSYPVSIYSITRVSGGVTAVFTSASSPLVNSGLTNGVTYVYTIQTVDSQGHLSLPTAPVTGLPQTGPSVPGNVAAASGDQAVQITWSSSASGTYPIGSYQVYKSIGAGSFSLLTTLGPSATGFVDTALTNGTNYSYYLVALDNFGVVPGLDISANSVTVNATPNAINVNPPSSITASGGVAQVVLNWTDAFTGAGSPVTGYQVFRSVGSTSSFSNLPNIAVGVQTLTDSSLTNGTNYYYYFVSFANGTASSNSATVLGIPSAPPIAPTPVAVVDGNASVTLNWTASPNQGSVTILKYAVIQNILSGSPVTFFTSGPVTTYTDSPLSNGTPVTYQVAAVNSNNTEGSPSSTVISYPYAPFAPTGLTSSASAAAMTLNWTPAVAPSWTVTQFAVLRVPAGGGAATTILTAAPPLMDASGTQGKLYVYSVEAMDNKGHFSAASSPVTDGPAIAPAAPATLIATAGDGQILLDWPATVPAAGAMPISYYVLTGTDGLNQIVPATQTWFLDSPLADPTAVTYTIYAVDISGQVSSPVHVSGSTISAIATTSASNLNPPTGLTAALVGNAAIKLTWVRPNDEGKIVTSYNIYRTGSFSAGGGSLLANIPNPALAPVTTYTDSSVASSNTYYYVVRAVYGPSSTESPNSNHASAQTPAPGSPVPPVTVGQMAFDANLFLPLTGQKLGIYYDVPNDGVVELDIYNIAGNRIETLVPGMTTANAAHSIFWDGKDRNGHTVASGLYLIEIRATGFHQIKKVAVVK